MPVCRPTRVEKPFLGITRAEVTSKSDELDAVPELIKSTMHLGVSSREADARICA
jgi:hypothetical protein